MIVFGVSIFLICVKFPIRVRTHYHIVRNFRFACERTILLCEFRDLRANALKKGNIGTMIREFFIKK